MTPPPCCACYLPLTQTLYCARSVPMTTALYCARSARMQDYEHDSLDDGLRGSGFEGGVFDEGEEEEPEYQTNWK